MITEEELRSRNLEPSRTFTRVVSEKRIHTTVVDGKEREIEIEQMTVKPKDEKKRSPFRCCFGGK